MSKFAPPAPEYVGPPKWHGQANNKPIHRVVIHGTVSPCEPGGARNVEHLFKTTKRPSSAHYIVDPAEVLQIVYDSVVAFHAPPNTGSIGIELCDPVVGTIKRWQDKNHQLVLDRAALLTAQLCLAYDVPIRRIGPIRLRLGWKGICGHVDVSKAWHQTDHWDPGAFPWREFIRKVKANAKDIRSGAISPEPHKPQPAPAAPWVPFLEKWLEKR